MKYHPQLQPRDYETFGRVVYSCRVTTAGYEATFHGVSVTTARKRLNQIARGRFLARLTAWVSSIPPIHKPLVEWRVGDPPPDCGAVAYQAQKRWHDRPLRPTTVYTASRKLLAMYGLPPRAHLKPHQATHDLGLLEDCRYCRRRWPELQFVGEDIFSPSRGHGEGVEDAQLVDGDRVFAAVEYAGSYRKSRVWHFHQHVSERGLDYLLWLDYLLF